MSRLYRPVFYTTFQFVLLLAAVLPEANGTAESKSVLLSVRKCPSVTNLATLSPDNSAKDLGSCAAQCARSSACAGIHFSTALSKCYLGNSDQLSSLWNTLSTSDSDGCVSYVSPAIRDSLMAEPTDLPTTTAAPLTIPGLTASTAAKLVILIDFRQGYTNLANPSKYAATPYGSITRDNQGAHFPGTNSDYIEIDTDRFSLATTYLNSSCNFTFFVKLVRQTWNQQNYHLFHDCNGNLRAEFCDRVGKLHISHSFPEKAVLLDQTETVHSTAELLNQANIVQGVAAAAVFTGVNLSALYFNGSAVANSGDLNHAYNGDLQCLRLGHNAASSAALKGRYICYAVANAALTADEIVELNQYCGN